MIEPKIRFCGGLPTHTANKFLYIRWLLHNLWHVISAQYKKIVYFGHRLKILGIKINTCTCRYVQQ